MKKDILKRFNFRFLIPIAIIVIILLAVYFVFIFPKNCGEDKACFDKAFKTCRAAKFITTENNNLYEYNIIGKKNDLCVLDVKIIKMGPEATREVKILFEGKSMRCKIPEEKYSLVTIDQMDNMIDYCSGPLKEAIYELMIDRMYGLVVKQLGGIMTEMQDILKNPI